MSPADKLLPLLRGVKRTGPGKWIALCPARDERSPSLVIRELGDGRLLLHDFGGASVQEVVGALGLQMADLFPQQQAHGAGHEPVRRAFSAVDLIDLAAWESSIVAIIASDIINGKEGADFDRLMVAAGRLADVRDAVHAGR